MKGVLSGKGHLANLLSGRGIRLTQLQRQRDALDCTPVEGKVGQGKNDYRLNHIRASLRKTSEAWVNSVFLVLGMYLWCCTSCRKIF